MDEDKQES